MHIIKLEDWDYTCGDGCCYEYGIELIVDGESITRHFDARAHSLKELLDALGVEAEVTEEF